MSDLKPIGSEKLTGDAKIKRILEIARYKETIPQPVNETSKDVYSRVLADGREYEIVHEKLGYIIKRRVDESKTEYLSPIENRKYSSSYSKALRKLNLLARELNEIHGNKDGVSLFGEQKKYVLKTPRPEPSADASDMDLPDLDLPSPQPQGSGGEMPADDMGGDLGGDMGDEMPADDMGGDMGDEMPADDMGGDMGDEMPADDMEDDEMVTYKGIQKLVGKLGQKIRTYEESKNLESKEIKYVLNSILSALNLNNLDEDDKDEILDNFENSENIDVDADMGDDMDADIDSDLESDSDIEDVDIKPKKKVEEPKEGDDDDDAFLESIMNELFIESTVDQVILSYLEDGGKKKVRKKR